MTDHTQISLEDLGDGYAAARFHEELKRVLANIDDPNTDWKDDGQGALEAVALIRDRLVDLGVQIPVFA